MAKSKNPTAQLVFLLMFGIVLIILGILNKFNEGNILGLIEFLSGLFISGATIYKLVTIKKS